MKTGTDATAGHVDLAEVTETTIAGLSALIPPMPLPEDSRVWPTETKTWRVRGTLVAFKLEADSDYHVVIADEDGRTMIVELPSPRCVSPGSPFRAGIEQARDAFDARLTATKRLPARSRLGDGRGHRLLRSMPWSGGPRTQLRRAAPSAAPELRRIGPMNPVQLTLSIRPRRSAPVHRTLVLAALLRCRTVSQAAELLGVDVGTFVAWMREHGLTEPPRQRPALIHVPLRPAP